MADPLNLTRRSLIERMMLIIGATATGGFSMSTLAKAATGTRHLDEAKFTVLGAVADTIVPKTDSVGALDADVPARFDALLKDWASAETRGEIVAAIAEIDALAREKQGKSFAVLDAATRHDILAPHDATSLKVLPSSGKGGMASFTGFPNYTNPGYGRIKELVVTLYYLSEPALTQELIYEHAPGEWQPSIPVTPETRPAGGIGF
ncbi:hypothetical protein GCM10011494_00030 [Novosphingobium endophyticum]|uniref:Gluconate 2-dehydrogenase subunit 3 family protein n=1 Tax=Novosphingobium endophyticum TaxID=1955250 RepID=A0A916TNJ1_9SPHN|nr:gluconate 2-dehydrogenase subunit 3 family protein [Novosphingobium endophyticum]GGB85750.1 hypothetical protein GCM10011494_00030 [Novosphingobium endophyticum]